MKKYVWLLAIAAFAVAVLAMVGCRPAETPTPTPSPSPTPQPTPTPDTRCPQPVSTVVRSLYNPITGDHKNKIQIVITFDEPIAGDVDCIEDPNYWTFKVVNPTRYDSNPNDNIGPSGDVKFGGVKITLSDDGKKITIEATVTEGDVGGFVYGLICDEDSAEAYRKAVDALGGEEGKDPNGSSVSKYAKFADKVVWTLSAWCDVYDDLGNRCCEDLTGEACCSPVCEPVTTPSGCPL
jgi:hypothetical protein